MFEQYIGYQRDERNPSRVVFQLQNGETQVAPAEARATQDIISSLDARQQGQTGLEEFNALRKSEANPDLPPQPPPPPQQLPSNFEEIVSTPVQHVPKPVSRGGASPAVTRLSREQASGAIASAWRQQTGQDIDPQALNLLTAQWAHETADGSKMYNNNFAGIKGSGSAGSVNLRTREGAGDQQVETRDGFRAYNSPEEGAADYISLLQRRYPEALAAAQQGDTAGFVRGLKENGYFTGDEQEYMRNVARYAGQDTSGAITNLADPPQVPAPQQQGLTPTQQTITERAGVQTSPGYRQTLADAATQEAQGLEQASIANQALQQARAENAAQQRQQAEEQIVRDQKAYDIAKREAEGQKALFEQRDQDVQNWKEDPDRIFSGPSGTWKRIGAAIAAAAGAFGAALARTPNFAQEIIDRAIDRDINAQRADYNKKKGQADNAYARYIQAGASEQQAELMVRTGQRQVAIQQLSEAEAKFAGQSAAANFTAAKAQIARQVAGDLERINQLSQGEVVTNTTLKLAGGKDALERDSLRLSNALKLKKLQQPGDGSPKTEFEKKGERVVKIASQTRALLDKYADDAQPNLPSTRNVLSRAVGGVQNFVAGEGASESGLSEEDKKANQDFLSAQNDLAAMNSVMLGQGALAQPEFDRAASAISGARTFGELKRAFDLLINKAGQ